MRYLVKACVKPGSQRDLVRAIDDGTLGKGSIAGDEYLYNMEQARVNDQGVATWVETCFCDPPLVEERSYWEEYFQLLSVKDAHPRRSCRHENGTNRGPAVIAIARRNLKSGSRCKARRFSTNCARLTTN
jgi:hypothetical protein